MLKKASLSILLALTVSHASASGIDSGHKFLQDCSIETRLQPGKYADVFAYGGLGSQMVIFSATGPSGRPASNQEFSMVYDRTLGHNHHRWRITPNHSGYCMAPGSGTVTSATCGSSSTYWDVDYNTGISGYALIRQPGTNSVWDVRNSSTSNGNRIQMAGQKSSNRNNQLWRIICEDLDGRFAFPN